MWLFSLISVITHIPCFIPLLPSLSVPTLWLLLFLFSIFSNKPSTHWFAASSHYWPLIFPFQSSLGASFNPQSLKLSYNVQKYKGFLLLLGGCSRRHTGNSLHESFTLESTRGLQNHFYRLGVVRSFSLPQTLTLTGVTNQWDKACHRFDMQYSQVWIQLKSHIQWNSRQAFLIGGSIWLTAILGVIRQFCNGSLRSRLVSHKMVDWRA